MRQIGSDVLTIDPNMSLGPGSVGPVPSLAHQGELQFELQRHLQDMGQVPLARDSARSSSSPDPRLDHSTQGG